MYLHRCKLNDAEKAIVAERIFAYDVKCTEAIENLGVSISKRKYKNHIHDFINDVMGDNNELNISFINLIISLFDNW